MLSSFVLTNRLFSVQETGADAGRRGRPPHFLEQLEALYGDHNRNMGIFMSAGGVRSSTSPSVFRPEDLGGPSSYNSGDKRCTRDHVVNSPQKKKSCDVGEYMACLSKSIAARSTSRDRERTRE
jgi:hypothetical protein